MSAADLIARLERKAPNMCRPRLRDDFHLIVSAANDDAARAAYAAFERTWRKRCPAAW
jgi:transposase-like protein